MDFGDKMDTCYVPQPVYILKVPTFRKSKAKHRWLWRRVNILPRNWIATEYIIMGAQVAPKRFMEDYNKQVN